MTPNTHLAMQAEEADKNKAVDSTTVEAGDDPLSAAAAELTEKKQEELPSVAAADQQPETHNNVPAAAATFHLHKYFYYPRKQEVALAQLVVDICMHIRRQEHAAQLAERTVGYLLRREHQRQKVRDFEFDDAKLAKIAAASESPDPRKSDDDEEALDKSTKKQHNDEDRAAHGEFSDEDEDLDEMEAAVNAAYEAAITRSKGCPQPPLVALSSEERDSL